MDVVMHMLVRDSMGNNQLLSWPATLYSMDGSLATVNGCINYPTLLGLTVDCLPDAHEENSKAIMRSMLEKISCQGE